MRLAYGLEVTLIVHWCGKTGTFMGGTFPWAVGPELYKIGEKLYESEQTRIHIFLPALGC